MSATLAAQLCDLVGLVLAPVLFGTNDLHPCLCVDQHGFEGDSLFIKHAGRLLN